MHCSIILWYSQRCVTVRSARSVSELIRWSKSSLVLISSGKFVVKTHGRIVNTEHWSLAINCRRFWRHKQISREPITKLFEYFSLDLSQKYFCLAWKTAERSNVTLIKSILHTDVTQNVDLPPQWDAKTVQYRFNVVSVTKQTPLAQILAVGSTELSQTASRNNRKINFLVFVWEPLCESYSTSPQLVEYTSLKSVRSSN